MTPYDAGPRSRRVRYQIADPYLHFFHRFIARRRRAIETGAFLDRPNDALPIHEYRQWLGYAFERWCRAQHHRIAEILGFSGVRYRSGAWIERDRRDGFQFDLVFDRADRVLTVCDIKYTIAPIGRAVSREFERRIASLRLGKRATLHRVLVSAAGADAGAAAEGRFDRIVTLEDLLRLQ